MGLSILSQSALSFPFSLWLVLCLAFLRWFCNSSQDTAMNTVNLFLSVLPHSPRSRPRAARGFQSPLSMGELSHEKSLVKAPREERALRGPTSQDRLCSGGRGPSENRLPQSRPQAAGGEGAEGRATGFRKQLSLSQGMGFGYSPGALPAPPTLSISKSKLNRNRK